MGKLYVIFVCGGLFVSCACGAGRGFVRPKHTTTSLVNNMITLKIRLSHGLPQLVDSFQKSLEFDTSLRLFAIIIGEYADMFGRRSSGMHSNQICRWRWWRKIGMEGDALSLWQTRKGQTQRKKRRKAFTNLCAEMVQRNEHEQKIIQVISIHGLQKVVWNWCIPPKGMDACHEVRVQWGKGSHPLIALSSSSGCWPQQCWLRKPAVGRILWL